MQIIIKTDSKKLKRGFFDIIRANKIATANTLNTIAFLSRKNAIKKINERFIIRNSFTIRKLRVDKANQNDQLQNQQSILGWGESGKLEYMALHETGGIKKPRRGNTLSIAQLAARSNNKRSPVNRNLYIKKISKQTIISKKSTLISGAYQAFKSQKFLLYRKNIYKITSFNKSKNSINFNKQRIYNLNQKHATIKKNQWMKPSIIKPVQDGQNIYSSQIKKLLKKDLI